MGPRSSGIGIDPSDSPPVAAVPEAEAVAGARPRAAVTMRVTAMGDMALTVMPSGVAAPRMVR